MRTGLRALTLLLSAAIFVVGSVIGFRMLTASPEEAAAAETCTSSVVAAGSPLDSNVVTVNVFNASNRSGLANRVRIDMQANGFLGGQIGNSTSATKPKKVAILTGDKDDPRVKLVAAQFRDKVEYAAPDIPVESGITVVVGDRYRGLKTGATTTIETDRDISVCVPVVPLP
ncbi:LytR C-terminal domain-containing protein [Aeromicrobium wangtongii]|uniref:LytR C-terminal domain-containing protein n=1 Tax=Aeromicrobium wangtongii TaxID=2969247 RepID=UPI0020179D66|nr:LytR C-terminal domain-containing protein [Aeromicrobium wangtongii]MCL3817323.1 LytR C-terminal domain-containing protein [Aeromicrobium wangtongii]